MREKFKLAWVKVCLAVLALPASMAHASDHGQDLANDSLANSADRAGDLAERTPEANAVLGSIETGGSAG